MMLSRLSQAAHRCTSSVFAARTNAMRAYTASTGNAPFPSLMIKADSVDAQGSFAETQKNFLNPDPEIVKHLDKLLAEKNMGVVAHFYMDPELQGTLSALKWPHAFVADSLAMGEAAGKMGHAGVSAVACLGVDFMSESVKATLDREGYPDVPVFRLAEKHIGCSLAESAEKMAYTAWLNKAAETPNSLHVVYINTSLKSKGYAHNVVPTITCTSSNVVQTVLQAFAQIPDLTVWYGPDTYMGDNLYHMFQMVAKLPEDQIKQLHPAHNKKTIESLLQRFHYYLQGNCVVHHMFGEAVTSRVRNEYKDAYYTAHFEVPGEMFELAMNAQVKGKGVVGSTSNILNFIKQKTEEAAASGSNKKIKFVLGTEAGMITSIVRGVQSILKSKAKGKDTEVEIIFPVAADAIAQDADLQVVPGVAGGEGCSTAGGCATCPYMKMNSLDALIDVVERYEPESPDALAKFKPSTYSGVIRTTKVTDLGVTPIQHMRDFMKAGKLSDELVKDIITRKVNLGAPETREQVA